MAEDTELVVGRGRLFFERFEPGVRVAAGKERYLGNTPELSITQAVTTLDHYSSASGMKTKDRSATISNDKSGTFRTDDISAENVALWFLGDGVEVVSAAAVAVVSDFEAVTRGTWLQLGVSAAVPGGARAVSNVVVETTGVGAAVVDPANYDVDLELGRVLIHDDAAAFVAAHDVEVTFDVAAGTENMVIPQGTQIEGALRFLSDNAVGENKDHYWPYVRISPTGDYALIGDDWQSMQFAFEVLRPDGSSGHVVTVRA